MGRIFDVFILNLLWLLCCLPVFTIGPSTTAFYYAMINLVRGEDNSAAGDFFRSFRLNFKQGMILGIPLTAIGVFLAVDIAMSRRAGTGIYTFFMVFFAMMFLVWAFLTLYTFPLLAKFEKGSKDLLLWAFTLSIKHLGKTLLMLLTLAVGLWLCHILPGLIFIMFGLVGQFHSIMIASILKPYLPDIHAQEAWKPLSFMEEAGVNTEEDSKDMAGVDAEEALTDMAGVDDEKASQDMAGVDAEEALTDMAGVDDEEAFTDMAGNDDEKASQDMAGVDAEEGLSDQAQEERKIP